jgi:iron only hydrogenase large subunit-like protein
VVRDDQVRLLRESLMTMTQEAAAAAAGMSVRMAPTETCSVTTACSPAAPATEPSSRRRPRAAGQDCTYEVRKSHENPAVAMLYEQFLTDGPCGHKSHELLHTHYSLRGKFIG